MGRSTAVPKRSVMRTPSASISATSPSSRKITSRVWAQDGRRIGGEEDLVIAHPDDERHMAARPDHP